MPSHQLGYTQDFSWLTRFTRGETLQYQADFSPRVVLCGDVRQERSDDEIGKHCAEETKLAGGAVGLGRVVPAAISI